MIQTARITTNIALHLLNFADSLAAEKEVTRRDIIEESLRKMELEKKGREITEAYNRMAEDKEEMDMWLSIANSRENLEW